MANKFTKFNKEAANGITNPKGNMGDFQHASRLYVDNYFALAPRSKFMYHVVFEINPQALKSPVFATKHKQQIGLLVKSADLPKFTIDTVTKNQYNRKKVVQTNIYYDPVNLVFHDDNDGVSNALWSLYYGYYYRDRSLSINTYSANAYQKDTYRAGLDNNQSVPFFTSISIYTLSRRRFLGYTLVNPMITAWAHGQVSQSDASGGLENTMTLAYENVIYTGGSVSRGSPKNFAELHYDTLPSPLSVAGGGTASLTGSGGVLAGLEEVFGKVSNGEAFSTAGSFLSTAVAAINTYGNLKNLSKAGLKAEAINILTSPAGISGIVNTVGGVVGAVFPKSQNTNTSASITSAAPRLLASRNAQDAFIQSVISEPIRFNDQA
jgi:hypothetical protein